MVPANATPKSRDDEWWFSTWGVEDRLWPVSTGKGVTVGLLDSGVNADLPDLRGAILPGTDATGGKSDGRTDSDDANGGHGTGMAALIAGQGSGERMAGVAPDAKILPIRVTHGQGEGGFTSSEASGIRYAADHGAKVISISVGTPTITGRYQCMPWLQEAIDYALQRDVVIVTAAGNNGHLDNPLEEPAACAGVLAVGAVDHLMNPWYRTGHHSYVTLAAPGQQVGTVLRDGRFHTGLSGTSQAAALTSGIVALVRAKFPRMTGREVVQRLIGTARDVGKPGRDEQSGFGLIRPYLALADGPTPAAANPVFSNWDQHMAKAKRPTQTPPPSVQRVGHDKAEERTSSKTPTYLLLGSSALALVAIASSAVWYRRRRKAANGRMEMHA